MTTLKKLTQYIEGNWDELKGKIKKEWPKLTDPDIKEIDGSYKKLISTISERYENEIDQVDEVVKKFIENILNPDRLTALEETVARYIDVGNYLPDLKKQSASLEENIKNNPIKWMGVALLGGFLLSKIISL